MMLPPSSFRLRPAGYARRSNIARGKRIVQKSIVSASERLSKTRYSARIDVGGTAAGRNFAVQIGDVPPHHTLTHHKRGGYGLHKPLSRGCYEREPRPVRRFGGGSMCSPNAASS